MTGLTENRIESNVKRASCLLFSFLFVFLCCNASAQESRYETAPDKYADSYIILRDGLFFTRIAKFKVQNGFLLGKRELVLAINRYKICDEIKIVELDKDGIGKFESEGFILDLSDNPVKKTDKASGKIIFKDDRVEIDGITFYKKCALEGKSCSEQGERH